MLVEPSYLPAAIYFPEGSNRAKRAREIRDVCTVVGCDVDVLKGSVGLS